MNPSYPGQVSLGLILLLVTIGSPGCSKDDKNALPESLASFKGVNAPRWSHDGTVLTGIARDGADSSLHVLNVKTGSTSLLVEDAAYAEWSPTDPLVVYRPAAPDSYLQILDYESDQLTELPGASSACGFAWSHDGTRIATTVGTLESEVELVIFDLNGTELFSADSAPGRRKCRPTWSPDDERIYYVGAAPPDDDFQNPEPIYVLSLADESVLTLHEGSTGSYSSYAAEVAGGHWFFLSRTRESGYRQVFYGEGDLERGFLRFDEGTDAEVAWRSQSSVVAITGTSPEGQLRLYDLRNNEEVYIAGPGSRGDSSLELRGAAWSPDGQLLAYVLQPYPSLSIEVLDVKSWVALLEDR